MKRTATRELVVVGLFAALTAVGARLMIPLGPVPFTLQPLVVFLCGVVLRPRAAVMSQLVYLVVGLIGLPVFAYGGGPGYVLHPTFGFIVGFLAAAWTISVISHGGGGGGWARTVAALAVGMVVLYGCGVAGLYLNLAVFQGKADAFLAVVLGFGWFVVFDLVKIVIAALLAQPVRRALEV